MQCAMANSSSPWWGKLPGTQAAGCRQSGAAMHLLSPHERVMIGRAAPILYSYNEASHVLLGNGLLESVAVAVPTRTKTVCGSISDTPLWVCRDQSPRGARQLARR